MGTHRKFGGAGLGLAICKELIHLLGGEIKATSELNAGSTFTFDLKCCSSDDPIFQPSKSTPTSMQYMDIEDQETFIKAEKTMKETQKSVLILSPMKTISYESSKLLKENIKKDFNILAVEDNLINRKVKIY